MRRRRRTRLKLRRRKPDRFHEAALELSRAEPDLTRGGTHASACARARSSSRSARSIRFCILSCAGMRRRNSWSRQRARSRSVALGGQLIQQCAAQRLRKRGQLDGPIRDRVQSRTQHCGSAARAKAHAQQVDPFTELDLYRRRSWHRPGCRPLHLSQPPRFQIEQQIHARIGQHTMLKQLAVEVTCPLICQ